MSSENSPKSMNNVAFHVSKFVVILIVVMGTTWALNHKGRQEQAKMEKARQEAQRPLFIAELPIDRDFIVSRDSHYHPAFGYLQMVVLDQGDIRMVTSGQPLPSTFRITKSGDTRRIESDGKVLEYKRFADFPVEVL